MTDNALFSSNEQTNVQESTLTENKSKYTEWSVEDLIKKAEHADAHISTLEKEMGSFRKQEETLQEVLRRLDQTNNTQQNTDPNTFANPHQERSNSQGSTLTQEDVDKLVSMSFDRKQKETIAKQNVEKVRSELKKTWGENYGDKLTNRMRELGVDQKYLESMAENYPGLFIETVLSKVIPSGNPNIHTPPSSSATPPKGMEVGNMTKYSEFKNLEKQNPNLRHDAVFQQRKLEAAAKHGSSFYN